MATAEKVPETLVPEHDSTAGFEQKKKNQEPDISAYDRAQLGVWEIIFADKGTPLGFSIEPVVAPLVQRYQDVKASVPTCIRFLKELYTIAPLTLLVMTAIEVISAILPTTSLYFDNRLFSSIETGLSTGKVDGQAIKIALAGRFFFQFITTVLDSVKQRYELKLRTACSQYFDEAVMKVVLSKGYVGWDGNYEDENRDIGELDPQEAFRALRNIVSISISTFSRAWFIYSLARSSSIGPTFLSLSLLQLTPFFDDDSWAMWARGFCWRAVDTHFLRMRAVRSLVDSSWYIPEIVGLNLDTYVVEQYDKAQNGLGNRDTTDIWRLMGQPRPFKDAIIGVANDWPTLYYAFGAIRGSTPFQFSTVSSMSTASAALRWNLQSLFGGHQGSVTKAMLDIKDMYERLELKVDPTSNGLQYPNQELSDKRGMGIELKGITFQYKASTADKPAVRGLNCKIEPGELVIIVGANGSGKTSLVKLLTRLYAPTEGDILIDGHPIGDYRVRDIRQATALLSQEHYILPLPLRENIGVGWVEDVDNIKAIQEAAKKGGAHKFISGRDEGYDTQLDPIYTKCSQGIKSTSKLYKEVYDKWEQSSSVSGGESQRIIASRTFMRIHNGNVKLVVVDEPSSAMDPAGEFELFKNLREARNGKTMIFITHRFGHLTKHADRILCMKDGTLAESGTHAELMALKGEYHHLYNIQAQAFSTEPETSGDFSPQSNISEPLHDTPAS